MAQPTLTAATHLPAAGTIVSVQTATNYASIGSGGAAQTWNYWQLLSPAEGTRNLFYLAPSVTSTSAAFPTATLLTTDGGTDTLFWRVGAQGLEQIGIRSSLEGTLAFTDTYLELKYPCTFGTTWTDPVGASYMAGPFAVTRTGTITGNADAYGTLNMPGGVSYPSVLRVRVRHDFTDAAAIATVRRITNYTSFYASTQAHPVIRMQEDSVLGTSSTWTVVRSLQWTGAATGVGIDEATGASIGLAPNPAAGLVQVSLDAQVARASEYRLVDASGRVVRRERVTGSRFQFDVSGLPSGVYQLLLHDGAAVVGTRRLVVQ
jgi:hypothetical protein